MQLESEIGSVAEGMVADLVILDADPMESVDNFRKIRSVFLRGQELTPDFLLAEPTAQRSN